MMRWGIVPWFANSEPEFKKLSTINAKSDRLFPIDRRLPKLNVAGSIPVSRSKL